MLGAGGDVAVRVSLSAYPFFLFFSFFFLPMRYNFRQQKESTRRMLSDSCLHGKSVESGLSVCSKASLRVFVAFQERVAVRRRLQSV
jgi:hypothetical protein